MIVVVATLFLVNMGSHAHTHTHNRVWNDAFARGVHAEMQKCACVRSTIDVLCVVVCCGCCRLILRLQCVRCSLFRIFLVPVRYHDSFRFDRTLRVFTRTSQESTTTQSQVAVLRKETKELIEGTMTVIIQKSIEQKNIYLLLETNRRGDLRKYRR